MSLRVIQIRSEAHRAAIESYSFSAPFISGLAILGAYLADNYYQQHSLLTSIQDTFKPSLVHELYTALERHPPVVNSVRRDGDKKPHSEKINEVLTTLRDHLRERMASRPLERQPIEVVVVLPNHFCFHARIGTTSHWFVSGNDVSFYPYQRVLNYQRGNWVKRPADLVLRTVAVRAFPGLYPKETVYIYTY